MHKTAKALTQAAWRNVGPAAAVCAGIALGACTTIGIGTGSVSPDGAPVTFAWKSPDNGTSGTMYATLADGTTFSGSYLEGMREMSSDDSDVLTDALQRSWVEWGPHPPYWDGGGELQDNFAMRYSGRVAVNLQASNGQRMRCHFALDAPEEGMSGGGQGTCKLDNGHSIDAVFPPA